MKWVAPVWNRMAAASTPFESIYIRIPLAGENVNCPMFTMFNKTVFINIAQRVFSSTRTHDTPPVHTHTLGLQYIYIYTNTKKKKQDGKNPSKEISKERRKGRQAQTQKNWIIQHLHLQSLETSSPRHRHVQERYVHHEQFHQRHLRESFCWSR